MVRVAVAQWAHAILDVYLMPRSVCCATTCTPHFAQVDCANTTYL